MTYYKPNHCAVCEKEIFPHWKTCQEHTRGNTLLDMDITRNKFGVQLCKQENDRAWKIVAERNTELAELKEQYDTLQENFHKLLEDGFHKYIKTLSISNTHAPEDCTIHKGKQEEVHISRYS